MLVVAACIGTTDASRPPASSSAAPIASPDPSTSDDPAPTAAPITPGPATPEPPTATPTAEPSPTDEPSASGDPQPAAACAGSDDNREFFASIAEVVSWPVYCPVLPAGWFVDSGQYRLAGGGWLEIAYRGPGGARLELREGTACAETACLPTGDDLGAAAFGDLQGQLVRLDAGRFAVAVGPADGVTWVATGSGLDQDAFVAIAADLARVGG